MLFHVAGKNADFAQYNYIYIYLYDEVDLDSVSRDSDL